MVTLFAATCNDQLKCQHWHGSTLKTVSIVIPCYNAGTHLTEAVESAVAQTWPAVEVIVVDDGSTDQTTLDILDEPSWPRTRIYRQHNAGPAAARNRAIREAQGDYILPLDADDTIEPDYVTKAVAVLDASPSVGCVYCKARKFGAEEGPWELPPYTAQELAVDNVIFVTALYRKEDWQTVGGYNERLRHGMEDYEFWLKLVGLGRQVVQLDECLFNYRVKASSRTTLFQANRQNIINTYAEIFRSNVNFFASHAEALYKHRFRLHDEVAYWHSRYGRIDAMVNRHPALLRAAKVIKSIFRL